MDDLDIIMEENEENVVNNGEIKGIGKCIRERVGEEIDREKW